MRKLVFGTSSSATQIYVHSTLRTDDSRFYLGSNYCAESDEVVMSLKPNEPLAGVKREVAGY